MYKVGVSICIPAFNEEHTVSQAVFDAVDILNKNNIPAEILVIDDCSTDSTWELLTKLKDNIDILSIRRHDVNCGIAHTFNELYLWSSYEFIFLYPADRQWEISVLLDMLDLTGQYDLIIAKRKNKQYNTFRRIISWLFNFIPHIFFKTKTYDAGSIKLARHEIYDIPTKSKGVFVEAERIIRANLKGFKIGYIEVNHLPRSSGHGSGASYKLLKQTVFDFINCWLDIVVFRNS